MGRHTITLDEDVEAFIAEFANAWGIMRD